jgi:imidazolonepropionase
MNSFTKPYETATWQTLITNVNLATMTDGSRSYGEILMGAIAISDGKIAWVGQQDDLLSFDENKVDVINGQGKWITPGLVDCHTHLVFGGQRANEFEMRLQGKSYQEIAESGGGIVSTVNATRTASKNELLSTAFRRLNTLHQEGVTTVEVKSGYGLDVENEIKMLEVAKKLATKLPVTIKSTFLGAHALPIEYKDDSDGYVDLVCNEMMPKIVENKLADTVDVFL